MPDVYAKECQGRDQDDSAAHATQCTDKAGNDRDEKERRKRHRGFLSDVEGPQAPCHSPRTAETCNVRMTQERGEPSGAQVCAACGATPVKCVQIEGKVHC
jgi:hypothetical protein